MIISPVKKWIIQKLSSIVLIPFIVWFLYNFASITNQNLDQFLFFLDNTKNKIILSSFLIVFYLFFLITISEIFEDYISRNFIKNVANTSLVLFAIMINIITIYCIFNY